MAMGKRQLVLAALVVALGAAVYLNLVFNGNNNQLPATQAIASGGVASNTGRQLGQTLMVGGSAVSGKTTSAKGKSASSVFSKGSASKAAITTVATDNWFNQEKLTRQKAQDEAKEEIEKVLTSTASTSPAVEKDAVAKAAVLTQNIIKQADLETLIKAKGYPDCIVTLGNNQCSVVVKTKQNSQNDAVVIQDIVSRQTGLAFDKIAITERT